LAVYLSGHIAAAPLGRYVPIFGAQAYHLSLFMHPDCGSGSQTLGGQPENSISPHLITASNFPGDDISHSTFMQRVATPLGQTDADFIINLNLAAQRYQNNLPYKVPNLLTGDIGDGYNSSSYVAGLIIAAGGKPPLLFISGTNGAFSTPGYSHPIPVPFGQNLRHGNQKCQCKIQ
jgi:hypothetical protein